MKAVLTLIAISFLQVALIDAALLREASMLPTPPAPPSMLAASTEALEWRCPVEDDVEAESRDEAIAFLEKQCVEAVEQAVASREGVITVFRRTASEPLLVISGRNGLFHLRGLFLIQTWAIVAPDTARND